MLHILKDIIVNILSIVIVGLLAFAGVSLVLELNYLGLFLFIILLIAYITLLCIFYKKLFSKRLFISFEFITAVFWIGMFIIVNYLSNSGYWDNHFFGGLGEFLVSLFAIFISLITFFVTSVVLLLKKKKTLPKEGE